MLPLEYHLGPGARAAVVPDEMAGLEWVARDFEAGDTIVFPALTVHRALPNLTDGQMRLSVDYRFMLEGQELTESCLQPHMGGLTWPEVYEGVAVDGLPVLLAGAGVPGRAVGRLLSRTPGRGLRRGAARGVQVQQGARAALPFRDRRPLIGTLHPLTGQDHQTGHDGTAPCAP